MKIKTILISFILLLSVINPLFADEFTKSFKGDEAHLVQDSKAKHWCPVCGMNLKMFYKTNHLSTLENNKKRQYCSLRCLVVDKQEYNIDTDNVQVVDSATNKLIFAKSAFYVLGSKIKGTMSKKSKLAFAKKSDAEMFVKKYKGKIVDFKSVLESATNSLESDISMITKKKEKKIYPMGKKILTKMCNQNIDPKEFVEINQLKSAIKNNNLCQPLKEKQLQAVALYLWEVKRFGDLKKLEGTISVTKDEKCPICGMFVYKYPKWASQIFYGTKHYSFDGVKDLMKFYFHDNKNITKILVSDYYSQKAIDAKKAYFVIGSDIYGPMGDELIPFKNESDAKTFYMDHQGKKILKFQEITQEEIYKLDE